MRLHGIGHGRVASQQARLAYVPTAQAANPQCHQQDSGIGPTPLALAAQFTTNRRRFQSRVGGSPGKTGQGYAQVPGIVAPAFDPGRLLGVGRQVTLHGAPTLAVQALVDIGMQLFFRRDQLTHFNLRNAGGGVLPSASSRNAVRARDNRDITVPMGTCNAWAASL
ncbi:hypothetical protein D3C80_1666970 [compost metagenome]